MEFAFWLSFALIFYTYAGYPLLVAAWAKLRARSWQRGAWFRDLTRPADAPAPVSIVMAVHNGAALLPAKLEHLLSEDRALVGQVIVVSDGSTDETASILHAVEDPRLQSILLPERQGKAAAVNAGVAKARGEIVLFLDIRPWMEAGALASLVENFADPRVGCVAGELVLRSGEHDQTASAISGLYWRYEQWIRDKEAAVDSPVGVYGGFYAARRTLVATLPQGLILDDMYQPLSIIRQGFRSVLDSSAVVVDTWPASAGGEFKRKVRTLAGNYQLIALAPWMLGPQNRLLLQLVSHKLLRLVVPYCFALLLLSSFVLGAGSSVFLLFGIAQALFWVLAAVGLRYKLPLVGRIAGPAGALLVLNVAAVAALFRFFSRTPLWQTWTPTPVAAKLSGNTTADTAGYAAKLKVDA